MPMIDPRFAFLTDPPIVLALLQLLALAFVLGHSSQEPAPSRVTTASKCIQCPESVATGHLGYCSEQCRDDHLEDVAWFAEQAAEVKWELRRGRRLSGCEVCDGRIFVPTDQWDEPHNCGSANCR